MGHLSPTLLQQFVPLVSQDAAQLVVDFDTTFGGRSDGHADQAQIKVTPESFLARFQSRGAFRNAQFEFPGGALLLVNRYVPLGLTILGPIIVNIFLYHLLLFHMGLGIAAIVVILWCIVAFYHRQAFSGLFVQKSP